MRHVERRTGANFATEYVWGSVAMLENRHHGNLHPDLAILNLYKQSSGLFNYSILDLIRYLTLDYTIACNS